MNPTGKRLQAPMLVLPRQEAPAWARWAEVAALTAFAILAGPVVDPADPMLLGHRFPWPAMAPLAAALRYGSAHGLASGAALALAVVVRSHAVDAPGPEAVMGWLALAFAAGLFRDAWARRIRQLEASSAVQRSRLDGLVRAHRTLEESHRRLGSQQPGGPGSLRDAIDAIRRAVEESRDAGPEILAVRSLDLLGDLAHVHAAAFHPVDAAGRPGPALASRGGCAGAEGDALVLEAIASRAVVSVRDVEQGATELLAAIPLADVADRVHAVVAVRDMPFFALHDETLRLMAVLGGAIGDAIASRPLTVPGFRQELRRAARDASRHGVPAVLFRVRAVGLAGSAASRSFAAWLLQARRLSDEVAALGEVDGSSTTAVLMRVAGADEAQGFRARLVRAAAEEGCEIELRSWSIAGPDALRVVGEAEATLWQGAGSSPIPVAESRGVDHDGIARPVGASRG